MSSDILTRLRDIVGDQHVLDASQVSQRATHFWDATPLEALALVRPANTEQTAKVLSVCNSVGQSVVTHGGVTGLVDGNRSHAQDIILSLERQRHIDPVDVVGRTVSVGAGAILQSVQQAATEAGLQLGLDLGARGSCTIGGNISTNAGGLSVLRYGMAREQVLGLEAVLADGTVLSSMNHMMKNNAGYDLKQLFIGSEGTLGIVTNVVLRLRAATPQVSTALLAFTHFNQVCETLRRLDTELNGTLDAFEVIWQPFYALNTNPDRQDTARAPLSQVYPLYAIVETKSASTAEAGSLLENALAGALGEELIVDAVISQSDTESKNIWYIREHIDIALEHSPVFVYDISLPIASMEDYVAELNASVTLQWPDAIVYVYGHLADGNLHIIIAPLGKHSRTKDDTEHTTTADSSCIDDEWHRMSNQMVYKPLQALGGSISAEHGIGLSKKDYLYYSRTQAEIQLMKTLKQHLDPRCILNPGKVVDVDIAAGNNAGDEHVDRRTMHAAPVKTR